MPIGLIVDQPWLIPLYLGFLLLAYSRLDDWPDELFERFGLRTLPWRILLVSSYFYTIGNYGASPLNLANYSVITLALVLAASPELGRFALYSSLAVIVTACSIGIFSSLL